MNFKDPIFTYIGMALAMLAIVCGVFEWFDSAIAWALAGIFGCGSMASLRAYIKSSGYKTYIVAGIPIILGLLSIFGVIPSEHYQALLAAFAPIIGITLQQALSKAK